MSEGKKNSRRKVSPPSKDQMDLKNLQDMFGGKVEADVVHMVFAESGNDFEKTLEQLLEISGETKSDLVVKVEPPKLSMASIAKQMSDKPVDWKMSNGHSVREARLPSPAKREIKIPENVIKILDDHKHVMILMRGLPGSGKSSLADQIIRKRTSNFKTAMKFSADDFFRRNGNYNFNPALLPAAHESTQQRAEIACREKKLSLVVIDNTNIEAWEMAPYAATAAKYNFFFTIVEPDTEWRYDPTKCAKLNTHGVPYETIQKMLSKFRTIDSEVLFKKYLPPPTIDTTAESELLNGTGASNQPKLIGATCQGYDDGIESETPDYQQQSDTNPGNRTRLNHIFGGVKSWKFPEFPSDPAPMIEDIKAPNIVVCRNYCTQTTTKDFAILETQQSGSEPLDVSDDETSDIEFSFEVEVLPNENVTLDKGTDTPLFPGESIEKMIQCLKIEFPSVQEGCIVEILKSCCLNRDWATQVLRSFDPQHFDDFSWVDAVGEPTFDSAPTNSHEVPSKPTTLPFEMDINFALNLQEEFGVIEGSPLNTLNFDLDREVCALIHSAWKKAVAKNTNVKLPPSPVKNIVAPPVCEFEEIVNLETALAQSFNHDEDIDTSMSRKALYRSFPGIAQELIESVFASNGYNLEQTLKELRDDQAAKNLLNGHELNETRDRIHKAPDKQKSDRIPNGAHSIPLKDNPETRRRVKDLYQKQMDYVDKAKECVSLKKYAVASYYSEEAMKCQRLATSLITEAMKWPESNKLDLHELKLADAVSALDEFVRAKKVQLERSKQQKMTIEIITGWGSRGIPPKIKPAVHEFLKINKLSFSQPNQGMFRVVLTK